MYAAILAGGVGTRLWPRSRRSLPKQFADITGSGQTMIQATVSRIAHLVTPDRTFILTGEQYRSLAAQQIPALPAANILVEPSGRSTAPAIGLACIHLRKRDPDAVIAILHADHVFGDEAHYCTILQQAEIAAQAGYLAILGAEPEFPHTGYGYIKRSHSALTIPGDWPVFGVERFLEKPDLATAQRFLSEGGYYWNVGNFISRVDLLLGEFERQLPELYAGLLRIEAALDTDQATPVLQEVWPTLPNISIDHGIMEGAGQVAVVPLDAGWNDVGSWDTLETLRPADEQGNCLVQGDSVFIASRGNIISGGNRIIALVGVDNLVVVDTGDALLIGHKEQIQQVKQVVDELQNRDRLDLL
ncbi:MAG: mannose-1-phosphate guanylyltransferase [Caldilineaceae bacterium]|nr:mannose-1-phosphate guanylyltransferase [Caldilineaceae bacterium]